MGTIINGHEIAGRLPLFKDFLRAKVRTREKTQTRRIRGLERINENPDAWACTGQDFDGEYLFWSDGREERDRIACPYGKPGDIRVMTEPLIRSSFRSDYAKYQDDEELVYKFTTEPPRLLKWRWQRDVLTSIHMPHEAARTLVEITEVRVERLQDISEEDIDAEGFHGDFPHVVFPDLFPTTDAMDHEEWAHLSMQECFGVLWDSINEKRGCPWVSNPWVWVIEWRLL